VEQGLILGRYRPLAELGDGGHGRVDLAFDSRMSRRVAIKRIPLSHKGVQRLQASTGLQEARTSAMLNHPNIVTVYEWDTDNDEAFLIMEYVDGTSLAAILDEYAPLEADEAAAVLGSVCEALAHAHANGVLHLDLKPENVLVTRDGLVKVADFGVASLTNAAGQAMSAGGTLGYMPPEQLRGDPVDARSDVWTLGTLAYEVVTGAVPFASDTIRGALYKAENVSPPMPSEFVRGHSASLDEVLMTALAPLRAGRFSSAEDLGAELLPLLGDPGLGRDGLRELVAGLVDEESADEPYAQLGLWDRLLPWEPALRRAATAVASGWLAWSGMAALGLGLAPGLGAAAVAAAAAAFAPPYGLAVGLILVAAGGFTAGPMPGLFVAIAAAAWWLAVGRRGGWAAIMPVFAPLCGWLGISPALPLLTGLLVPTVWEAFAAGAAGSVVLVMSSAASGAAGGTFLRVAAAGLLDPLGQPGWRSVTFTSQQWIAVLGLTVAWAAAAGAVALFARRATRTSALAGAVIGFVTTLAGTGPWVTGGQQVTSGTALQFGLSSILIGVIIALGPPVAYETED
jgi:hypothetical protein